MWRGGQNQVGFFFCKRRFPNCKRGALLLPRTKAFLGGSRFLKTNTCSVLTFPLLLSLFMFLKIDFLFNSRLWGCSSLLSFGAGQAESARTKPSCFFGKANAKVGWAKGGWQMTSLPGLLLCRITKLQKELVASLTHPCLTLARPGLSVCQKFLLF